MVMDKMKVPSLLTSHSTWSHIKTKYRLHTLQKQRITKPSSFTTPKEQPTQVKDVFLKISMRTTNTLVDISIFPYVPSYYVF